VIVDCAVYTKGKRRPGNPDVAQLLEATEEDGDTFVWIGIKAPVGDEFREVAEELQFHPLAVEDAIHAHQRPKLELFGDVAFIVIKTAAYDDAHEAVELAELQLFVGPRYLVTVRHGETCDLRSVRHQLELQPEKLAHGPVAAVHAILDRVVDDYVPVLDGLDNDIIEIEAQVFSDDRQNPAGRIYKLKRQVLDMYRVVDPLLEPLERLHTSLVPMTGEDLRHYFRDVDDHLRRVASRIEIQRDLLSDVLQVNLSHVSVQQNDDMRRIAAWAAMAAVPTLLAGVWGMNFEHMPELDETWGYPAAVALMLVLVAGLYRYFRRQGWI
jgi:magnesium transporter